MKVITFFTVRGGSGKTVLSAAFASYASYILGKRTMVLDFDGPEYNLYNMRLRELSLTSEGDAECNRDELYIVEKVENTNIDILETNSASHSVPNALSINTFRNKWPFYATPLNQRASSACFVLVLSTKCRIFVDKL